jgi:ribosomal protein S26
MKMPLIFIITWTYNTSIKIINYICVNCTCHLQILRIYSNNIYTSKLQEDILSSFCHFWGHM